MAEMPPMFRPPSARTPQDRKRDADRRRRQAKPWRRWYSLAVWKKIRRQQLAAQPLCERCLERGDPEPATVCNHRTPHRGDWKLFVGGPFESLCADCHDRDVQREERAAAR